VPGSASRPATTLFRAPADLARIIGQIEEAARARFAGTGIAPVVVGTAQVVLRLAEHFTGGQISSMSWAAGTVWAIVAVFLGSPLLALFCLIPLLLTVAVSFGVDRKSTRLN